MSNTVETQIVKMSRKDFEDFWPTFEKVINAQKTYAFESNMTLQQAFHLWCEIPQQTYVAKQGELVLGTYYIKPNAAGPGDHICNCGYMVSEAARGKGLATIMCKHSQKVAVNLGFRAMQFNSVVSTNEVAVKLWQSLGYQVIGRIPEAYRHPDKGLVDSLIMYKKLDQ
ncbi:MAG: GNAT family N-acetyltransferase [Kangiellaceae bacterium]|nr:GNAT family N-acetyltransferase [Kangiellaceae bacterium]MCW9016954.1 GNAT family N-acetyltransferase [Kangiellaceae bacterium]